MIHDRILYIPKKPLMTTTSLNCELNYSQHALQGGKRIHAEAHILSLDSFAFFSTRSLVTVPQKLAIFDIQHDAHRIYASAVRETSLSLSNNSSPSRYCFTVLLNLCTLLRPPTSAGMDPNALCDGDSGMLYSTPFTAISRLTEIIGRWLAHLYVATRPLYLDSISPD